MIIAALLLTAAHLTAPPTPDPRAVDIALRCVCQTHPNKKRCQEERREDVTATVADLLTVTDKFPWLPSGVQPVLIAVACGEGGFRDRPDCGGNPRCNDRGTSGGMFQIKLKGGIAARYFRGKGKVLDVYDHTIAGRYYLERLDIGAARLVPAACPGVSGLDLWDVALYRLGRGPWIEKPKAAKTFCGLLPVSESIFAPLRCLTVPATPGVRRCAPGSKYARWARAWAVEAPGAWTMVGRRYKERNDGL